MDKRISNLRKWVYSDMMYPPCKMPHQFENRRLLQLFRHQDITDACIRQRTHATIENFDGLSGVFSIHISLQQLQPMTFKAVLLLQ